MDARRDIALARLVQGGAGTDVLRDSAAVQDLLHAVRRHLGMDLAFVSEFSATQRRFMLVDTDLPNPPVRAGDSGPLAESYCQRVVDGRLPGLIRDASKIAAALALPVTAALPVGAHLSVPIRLGDGTVYGTFCCFSHSPDESLNDRDLAMLRVCAELTGRWLDRERESLAHGRTVALRVDAMLASDDPALVFQPICGFDPFRVVGWECLSRFASTPARTPAAWFADAREAGRAEELELRVVRRAIAALPSIPGRAYVSINASPAAADDSAVRAALAAAPLERIVLEITEHDSIECYATLTRSLAPLRAMGLRVAVDDAGAGYATFQHILELKPDIIKLDVALTRDIDRDRNKRSLTAALVAFAGSTGCEIVAEGVETAAELRTLLSVGVRNAQGFGLGVPAPLECVQHGYVPPSEVATVARELSDRAAAQCPRIARAT